MIYHRQIPVEFNHCDPAGIVFYPRYFEMTNSVVENFFREVIGHSFAAMMSAREGVPTASIDTNFHAPSRLGEVLDWHLVVARTGTTSVGLCASARCEGVLRVTANLTLVRIGADGRPMPWTDAMRTRFAQYQETANA